MNKFSCELSTEDKRSLEEDVKGVCFGYKRSSKENYLLGKDMTITAGTIKGIEVRFESELRLDGGDANG